MTSAPRQLSDLQRAAHIVLPLLAAELARMRAEVDLYRQHQRVAKKKDAAEDWADTVRRSEQRLEGAQQLVEAVKYIARGQALDTPNAS